MPVNSLPQREPSTSDAPAKNPLPPLNSPGTLSKSGTGSATSGGGEDTTHLIGYLKVNSGGRVRYVGNAFWALVKRHV